VRRGLSFWNVSAGLPRTLGINDLLPKFLKQQSGRSPSAPYIVEGAKRKKKSRGGGGSIFLTSFDEDKELKKERGVLRENG